jgi:RNA polymerase sigma factor (sigma-70 family)
MAARTDIQQIIEGAYATNALPLLRHLTAATRDPSAAEDLTQEVFVRLIVELGAGRVPDDLAAWSHRVGLNLAMSRGRRMAVADRHAHELLELGSPPSPEAVALAAEQHESRRDAVAALGATDQRALILSANGYRGPEIARSIGRSDAATRTLLCRARTKVRARMAELDPPASTPAERRGALDRVRMIRSQCTTVRPQSSSSGGNKSSIG